MHSKLQYRNHKHKLNIKSRFTLICFQDHDLHTPTFVINLNIKNESKAALVLKGQKEGGKLLVWILFFFLILSSVLCVKLLEDQCVIIKDNN